MIRQRSTPRLHLSNLTSYPARSIMPLSTLRVRRPMWELIDTIRPYPMVGQMDMTVIDNTLSSGLPIVAVARKSSQLIDSSTAYYYYVKPL